jgi:hypothetical protein
MLTMFRNTSYVALMCGVVAGMLSFVPELLGQTDPTSVGFIGPYKTAAEKTDPSKLPIIGAWRINLAKSDPGIQPRFTPTAMNIFIAENGGIRQEVYQDYPPKVNTYKTVFDERYRSWWFKLDGQNIYKDPQGPNGMGQTVAMWLADRNTLYRERATKGVVDEKVLYRVSPDGKTLVWTSFMNANGNSGQNVWDRVEMPPRPN